VQQGPFAPAVAYRKGGANEQNWQYMYFLLLDTKNMLNWMGGGGQE